MSQCCVVCLRRTCVCLHVYDICILIIKHNQYIYIYIHIFTYIYIHLIHIRIIHIHIIRKKISHQIYCFQTSQSPFHPVFFPIGEFEAPLDIPTAAQSRQALGVAASLVNSPRHTQTIYIDII